MGAPEQDLGLRKREGQVGIPQLQVSKPHFSSLSPSPNTNLCPQRNKPIPKIPSSKFRS